MSENKKDNYGIKDIAIDLIQGKVEYADEKERLKRLDICKQCPKFNSLLVQCMECGCFLKAKTKFKNSKCPLGKW